MKWATCNVGASSPTESGDYFAWGETKPKSTYTEENSVTYNHPIRDISGYPTYDAARANWGGTWRMPTKEEMHELIDKCNWKWTTQSGIAGSLFTGPNGNQIFLPAAGYRDGSSLGTDGSLGDYWSSTPYDWQYAYELLFDGSNRYVSFGYRYYGKSVRAVSK